VRLPRGDDPDSLIRKGGPDAFRAKLDEAVDFLDFFVDWQTHQEGTTPTGRRKVVEAVAALLGKVENAVSRTALITKAAMKLGLGEGLVREEVQKARKQVHLRAERESVEAKETAPAGKTLEVHPVIRELLLLVMGAPSRLPEVERRVDEVWLKHLAGEELFLKIRNLYRDDAWTGLADLLPHLEGAEQDFVTGLEAGVWEKHPENDWDGALERLAWRMEGDFLRREAETLTARLRTLNQGDPNVAEVLRQQGELLKKRARLTPGTAKANS